MKEDINPALTEPRPLEAHGVSARLRAARKTRGLTQGAVAIRTQSRDTEGKGISRTAIVAYEQGTSSPGLRELVLLCEVLFVTPNWVIYGTESAAQAVLPSMENLPETDNKTIRNALATALVLCALKPHERDSLQTIVLSFGGRQLGDSQLSGLMFLSKLFAKPFFEQIKDYLPDGHIDMTIENMLEAMSTQVTTNIGNKLIYDEEGDPIGGKWMYKNPKK